MPRPIRVEFPNAYYHVINRGNRKEQIFITDRDYELFLEKLVEYTDLYEVEIHTYCLMPNHFHLQLRTRHANLGKFMQSFLTSYTLVINHKYQKSGHLFQGRYKAQLVENEKYKNKLSRYIHLNPVKVRSMAEMPSDEKKKYLRNFKWSSFRMFIGLENKPEWLTRSHILSSWGKTAAEKMHKYRTYVEEGIASDNSGELQTELQEIIGSDSFKDKIIKKFLIKDTSDIDKTEQPVLFKINTLSLNKVIDFVTENLNHDIDEKLKRKITIYIAFVYCKKNYSLKDIAAKFELSVSGLRMVARRFKTLLEKNKELHTTVGVLNEKLEEKYINVQV